jgi:hypothetical protein
MLTVEAEPLILFLLGAAAAGPATSSGSGDHGSPEAHYGGLSPMPQPSGPVATQFIREVGRRMQGT